MLIATDPATPVLPPLAPEIDAAWKLARVSVKPCPAPPALVSLMALPATASSRDAASEMRRPSTTMA